MKTVLAGAVVAAAAGLLVGSVARPELNVGDSDRPQSVAAPPGMRPGETSDNAPTFAAYNRQVPDYAPSTDGRASLTRAASADGAAPSRLARSHEPPYSTEDPGFTQTPHGEPPQAAPVQGGDASPAQRDAEGPAG